MNAMCIRCGAQGMVSYALCSDPVFACGTCQKRYTAADVRRHLDQMNAAWEPILKWLDAAPKEPGSDS